MYRRLTLSACILLAACSEQVAPPEKPLVRVEAMDATPANYAPILV